jgi:16S rRNA (cytidine1402-2'-O)-methyltransferase
MANLYVIATPIGNLEDITLRALRILKEVDMIVCEDTRQTKKLLFHYEIHKPLISYHQHSRIERIDEIIKLLAEGKKLALVADSGTPAISDPGGALIYEVTQQLGDRVKIIPIPGPSALSAALSVAGVPADKFIFLGFLPHKKGREKLFKEIAAEKRTVVFYESPHRALKTLNSLLALGNRQVIVLRELTKVFEEIVRGTPEEILKHFETYPDKVKGEFVIIISK